MDNLEELIKNGENSVLELKSELPIDHSKYLKTAVAFSNCKGGKIIFGVNDRREIVGLQDDPFKLRDAIVDALTTGCRPQINFEADVYNISGKEVIVVSIAAGQYRPYYLASKGRGDGVFVRVGASSRLADEVKMQELSLEGLHRYFDETEYISDQVSEDDPRIVKLCDRISKKNNKTADASTLVNLGLLKTQNGGFTATNGFELLTDNPFYQARIECVCYKGTVKNAILDRRDITGNIVDSIEPAVEFVLKHINYGASITGVFREDRYEIPVEALREIVTNAVVHRNYLVGSPIFIEVYDDRVSVISPGTFPMNLSLEQVLSGRSAPRNLAIFRYFREIGLSECYGSGIRRTIELCRAYCLKVPRITDDGNFVEFVFRRSNQRRTTTLSENEEKFVQVVERNPSLTIRAISGTIGVSVATGNRICKSLQEKGVLTRDGSRKTGEWILDQLT